MLARLGNLPQRHGAVRLHAGVPDADFRTYGRCERIPVRPDPCLRNSLSRAGHANPPGIGISLAQIAGITKSRQRAADAPPRDWHIACGNCGNSRLGLPARYRERCEGGAETAETHFSPRSIRTLFLGAMLVTAMLASPTTIQAIVFFPPSPAFAAPLRSAKSPWSTRARVRPARQLVGSFGRLEYVGSMVPTYSQRVGRSPASHQKNSQSFQCWKAANPRHWCLLIPAFCLPKSSSRCVSLCSKLKPRLRRHPT